MTRLAQAATVALALLWQGLSASAQSANSDTLKPPPAAIARPPLENVEVLAPKPSTITVPLPAGCDNQPSAIGLSRIVEIDTSGGPRFGHSQYQDVTFLADGEVVLTFDDGPLRRTTQRILDTLDAHCTRATFFSVGRMALSDPEMLKETERRGHTIASHTWSHAKLSSLSAAKAKMEIELGLSAVTKALGHPVSPFFRFPYLRDSKTALEYLRSRNLSAFSIEVDSQDFRTRNPGQVLRNVMSQLKSVRKGIILFHDIQPSTVGALASLLDNLKENGFKVVHLIAKDTATTLPEYDAMAEKEIERRRLVLSAQPLADRAVTWPNSGPDSPAPGAAVPAAAASTKAAGAAAPPSKSKSKPQLPTPVQPAAASDAAPWVQRSGPPPEQAGPPSPPAPPVVRRPKPIWQNPDEDPWRIRTMGD